MCRYQSLSSQCMRSLRFLHFKLSASVSLYHVSWYSASCTRHAIEFPAPSDSIPLNTDNIISMRTMCCSGIGFSAVSVYMMEMKTKMMMVINDNIFLHTSIQYIFFIFLCDFFKTFLNVFMLKRLPSFKTGCLITIGRLYYLQTKVSIFVAQNALKFISAARSFTLYKRHNKQRSSIGSQLFSEGPSR